MRMSMSKINLNLRILDLSEQGHKQQAGVNIHTIWKMIKIITLTVHLHYLKYAAESKFCTCMYTAECAEDEKSFTVDSRWRHILTPHQSSFFCFAALSRLRAGPHGHFPFTDMSCSAHFLHL